MIYQSAAAYHLTCTVVNGQEYLTAITDNIGIDMGESIQVRLLQSEIGLYPLPVQTNEVCLVLFTICCYLNNYPLYVLAFSSSSDKRSRAAFRVSSRLAKWKRIR